MGDEVRARGGRVLALAVALCVVLALVAGAVLATRAGDADGPDLPRHRAGGTPDGTQTVPPLRGTVLATVGVASFNAYWRLDEERARQDWRRLTSRQDVDLVGWQETNTDHFRAAARAHEERGWRTWQYEGPRTRGPVALAVSWREDVWRLRRVTWRRVHGLAGAARTDAPYPPRWIQVAELEHRASGRAVTLLNTHVDSDIETGDGFQDNLNARSARRHFRMLARSFERAPGDVVVGTGDYNFDHHDDLRARPAGGITDTFEGRAVTSYHALGHTGLTPTLRTRWIDYVVLARRSLKGRASYGTAQFARQRVLDGFHSDHHPLVVTVRLYR